MNEIEKFLQDCGFSFIEDLGKISLSPADKYKHVYRHPTIAFDFHLTMKENSTTKSDIIRQIVVISMQKGYDHCQENIQSALGLN